MFFCVVFSIFCRLFANRRTGVWWLSAHFKKLPLRMMQVIYEQPSRLPQESCNFMYFSIFIVRLTWKCGQVSWFSMNLPWMNFICVGPKKIEGRRYPKNLPRFNVTLSANAVPYNLTANLIESHKFDEFSKDFRLDFDVPLQFTAMQASSSIKSNIVFFSSSLRIFAYFSEDLDLPCRLIAFWVSSGRNIWNWIAMRCCTRSPERLSNELDDSIQMQFSGC